MKRTALFLLPLCFLAFGCASSSKKKKKKKKPVASEESAFKKETNLQRGFVKFSVKNADLKTEVLPIFLAQANVKILWEGNDNRTISSLNFTQPIEWEEAMQYVCRFTNTHLTTDYQGRYVLRDGWAGELDGPIGRKKKKGKGKASGRVVNSKSWKSSRGKSSSGSKHYGSYDQNKGTGGHPDAYGGGAANKARNILTKTSTTHSGQ